MPDAAADIPARMNQAQFAEHMGVTRQAVGKWVKAGKIPAPGPDRKIDVAQAEDWLRRSRDPGQALGQSSAAVLPPEDDPADPADTTPVASGGYARARTASAAIDARRKQIELQRLQGSLLPRDMVEDAMATAGGRIASAMESLANESAALTSAAQDGEAAVTRELRRIIRSLRQSVADAVKLETPDDDDLDT